MTPSSRPEYTEEYKKGYKSYEEKESSRACPYLKGSRSYELWMRGYNDAKEEESE